MAPFFYVGFADFWVADQLNSIVPVFLDIQYFYCFYVTENGLEKGTTISNVYIQIIILKLQKLVQSRSNLIRKVELFDFESQKLKIKIETSKVQI